MAEQQQAKQRREGPNPPNILLTSVRRALDTGVDRSRIVIMLDMAIVATRATDGGKPRAQADTFRRVAETLDGWSDSVSSGDGTAPLP